jgi:hypothetical protein
MTLGIARVPRLIGTRIKRKGGIICPYPETSLFRDLQKQNGLLPGTVSRDYDGYAHADRKRKATRC